MNHEAAEPSRGEAQGGGEGFNFSMQKSVPDIHILDTTVYSLGYAIL